MRLLGNGTRYPVHDVQLPSSAEGFLELCDHVATTWERSERRSLLFSVAAEEVVDDVLPTRWFWTTVFHRGVGVMYIKVMRLLRRRSSAVLGFAESQNLPFQKESVTTNSILITVYISSSCILYPSITHKHSVSRRIVTLPSGYETIIRRRPSKC